MISHGPDRPVFPAGRWKGRRAAAAGIGEAEGRREGADLNRRVRHVALERNRGAQFFAGGV
jgi:hypothetical protein